MNVIQGVLNTIVRDRGDIVEVNPVCFYKIFENLDALSWKTSEVKVKFHAFHITHLHLVYYHEVVFSPTVDLNITRFNVRKHIGLLTISTGNGEY